jgi:thiol-disulfide isomerase/thioredoxin
MTMIKKFFALLWTLLLIVNLTTLITPSFAQTDGKVNITVLERFDCAHCVDEKAYLNELVKTRNDINVIFLDIYSTPYDQLFKDVAEAEGLSKSTPITLIGNRVVQGFGTADTTGKTFEAIINNMKKVPLEKRNLTFEQIVAMGGTGNSESAGETCGEVLGEDCEVEPLYVNIPFYGPLDLQAYALPSLSMILGLIDGFNPCAMWALVTFILILMQVGDRRRMWQLVGIFLVAQAVMYYLILNIWLTVWDFVGLDHIVTPIIGVVATSAGIYFLYKWWTYKGTCTVTDAGERKETGNKMQKLATAPFTIGVVLAIIGLAFSINIIEFACSIGIPQTFTKILDINNLSFLAKQGYMGLYMLMYMIDDLAVFVIALVSMHKLGLATKYANYSSLIGGLLMLLLGLIMLFKPELLIF